MTERRPPQRPPDGPPPLDAYRPRSDLPPQQQMKRPPLPPLKHPPRPLPPGAQPRRPVAAGNRSGRDGGGSDGRGLVAYAAFTLFGLLLIASAAIGYLFLNPPVDRIRNEVVAQVKAKTGRDLKINGATRLTFYPSVGVSLEQVELSPPPGMSGRPTATMASLDLNIGLLPLIGRRIEVDRLVLRDPVIELRTDKSGRKSWDMRHAAAGAPGLGARRIELAQLTPANRASDAAPTGVGRGPGAIAGVEQISLRDVRIENGTLVWHDERSGVRETITPVNVQAGMASIADPLEIKGNIGIRGEKLDVSGSLGSLVAMLEAQPSKVALKIRNAHATVGFDGQLGANLDADGKLDLTTSSLRRLASMAGIDVGTAGGLGQAQVTGRLTSSAGRFALGDARLMLDGVTATGTLGLDVRGARPKVAANLEAGEINLNPYLVAGEAAGAATARPDAPAPKKGNATTGSGERAPASIDDLLSRPVPGQATPQVRGFTQRAGWSQEPIRLAGLAAFDADVKLKAAKVVYHEIKLGQSRVSATLATGVLKLIFEEVALYEGRGRGAVTVDVTSPVLRFGANLAADGLSLQPLLRDAGAKSWLAGAAKLNVAVTGEGATQKAMIDGLAGKADIAVANGAVVGWNLAQIIRGLKQGQISALDRVETAKTDFSDLSATWTIAEGVAQNQDLKLNSPLMRVTGSGRVDLGERQLDMQIKPKLVASLEGQGATQGLGGLEIPLRVRGPWERPEIVPEIGDLLKDPDKAISAVKEIGKQFKGKSANEIVDQVLGDNPETAKKANDFLNKLLKPR